jgi:hypothetical protein
MKRSLALLGAAVILAAGLTGIAMANNQASNQLTGMTGCLTAEGELTDLAIGDRPLTPCESGSQQVSLPAVRASSPAPAPSLVCVFDKADVTWDKNGVFADFTLQWANLDETKVFIHWDADHPLPSGDWDPAKSEATGDWTYQNGGVDQAGFTLSSPNGRGTARIHMGPGNPLSSGSAPIEAMTLFPPDGFFDCSSG